MSTNTSGGRKPSLAGAIADIFRPDAKAARYLGILAFAGVSYGLYRGIQENYLANIIHINEFERGLVEFFRELPGLMVVLILAWMYRLTEARVFKIGLGIMLAGTLALVFAGGKFAVVAFMVFFSLGEHISMPVRTSLTLDMAKKEKAGAALGITGSLGQVGHIAGFLLVSALFAVFGALGLSRTDARGFRLIYAVSGFLMIGAFLAALTLPEPSHKVQRRRFYFARKFTKFYMLEVFYGARKQIFITFAPYVLILEYGADPAIMSLLYAVCAGCGTVLSPLVGRLIDKLGYKFIMVTDTLILVLVCLLYGFAHRIFPPGIAFVVVCANYVLDSIISMASMASNVYVQDIASSQEELTATISTGISVNHVISIFIALCGGWIWNRTGIEVLFSLSALLGLINSAYAATIKVDKKKAAP
jgi:MFS family permease